MASLRSRLRTKVRGYLREKYGWVPMYELRNKVRLGHTAVAMTRFEAAEVRRGAKTLPGGLFGSGAVAVVIPTYKRPELLRRAVDSVLAQTMEDLIVVVVDDCGGLPELPPDPRLHAHTLSRNSGIAGVNRNIGLRLTRSPYVAFLDDDNIWHPHHLESALKRLKSDESLDAVYTAMQRVTPTGRQLDLISVEFDRKLASNHGFLDINTFVARRSPAVRFSRLKRAKNVMPKEDWELIYRYTRRHRIEHIPEITVDYLVHPDSYWTPWKPEEYG
jgi:glycosyltransferase involved in cell wall biosynthesis